MKMKVKNHVIIIFTLFASCKIVENTIIKPIIEVLWIPLSNQDLLHLQVSIHHYKQINNKWPGDIEDLIENNKRDSIHVVFSKFNELRWSYVGDSLLVKYNLQYDASDTIPYRYLSGAFYLLPKMDTLYSSHIQIKGERKDGTMRFESDSEKYTKRKRPSN